MENINITTSHNVFINFQAAGIGYRALAFLYDSIFKGIFVLGSFIFASQFFNVGNAETIFTFIIVIIVVFYDLYMEIMFHGQSFGKMIVKTRVMKLDGTEPTFSSYLLRWLLSIVDIMATMCAVAILSVIVSKYGQRLGDMAANTTVVRIKENVNLEQLIMQDIDINYQTKISQVKLLSDSDIQLVKDLLYAFSTAEDKMVMYNNIVTAKQKFMEKMSIQSDIEPIQFFETLIKDYINEFGK